MSLTLTHKHKHKHKKNTLPISHSLSITGRSCCYNILNSWLPQYFSSIDNTINHYFIDWCTFTKMCNEKHCPVSSGFQHLRCSLLWPEQVKPPWSNPAISARSTVKETTGEEWDTMQRAQHSAGCLRRARRWLVVDVFNRGWQQEGAAKDTVCDRRAGDGLMTDAGRNENCSGFSYWGDGHTLGSDAVLLADKVLSWSSELLSRRSEVGGVALRFKEHVTAHCIVSRRVPSQGWLKPSYCSAGQQPH